MTSPNLTDLRRELREAAEKAEPKWGRDHEAVRIYDTDLSFHIFNAHPSNILALLDLLDRIERWAEEPAWGENVPAWEKGYNAAVKDVRALLAPTQGGN